MSNQIMRRVSESTGKGRELVIQMQGVLPLIKDEISQTFKDEALAALMANQPKELAAHLSQAIQDLETAEKARVLEAADDEVPRRRRDEASAKLYRALVETRPYLISGFGEGADVSYGLAGRIPQNPKRLFVFAKNTIDLLTEHPKQSLNRFGGGTDTEQVLNELQPLQEELEETLKEVGLEDIELRDAQTKRDRALDHLQQTFSGTSRMYTGLLGLIGRQDLIQKAQSITKTPKRSAEDPSVQATSTEALEGESE